MPNEFDVFEKSDRTGLVTKSANVSAQEVTEDELKKINKFTVEPLKAEEVFTFKMSMCDNETDDRNYEPLKLVPQKATFVPSSNSRCPVSMKPPFPLENSQSSTATRPFPTR